MFTSFRTYSGPVAFGYYSITPYSQAWALLLLAIFSLAALGWKMWKDVWRPDQLAETVVAVFLLLFVWLSIVNVRSIFSLILFLELAGLGILILFIKVSELESLNSKNSTNLATILFLWTSIFSVLLMLLGLVLSVQKASMQFDTLGLTSIFVNQSELGANLFIYIAVFLKLMLLPWHGALLSFYKQLPVGSFIFYLSFYYPLFLIIAPLFLIPMLALTSAYTFILWSGSLSSAILASGYVLTQSADIRNALAISSLFNLVIICTLLLL